MKNKVTLSNKRVNSQSPNVLSEQGDKISDQLRRHPDKKRQKKIHNQ